MSHFIDKNINDDISWPNFLKMLFFRGFRGHLDGSRRMRRKKWMMSWWSWNEPVIFNGWFIRWNYRERGNGFQSNIGPVTSRWEMVPVDYFMLIWWKELLLQFMVVLMAPNTSSTDDIEDRFDGQGRDDGLNGTPGAMFMMMGLLDINEDLRKNFISWWDEKKVEWGWILWWSSWNMIDHFQDESGHARYLEIHGDLDNVNGTPTEECPDGNVWVFHNHPGVLDRADGPYHDNLVKKKQLEEFCYILILALIIIIYYLNQQLTLIMMIYLQQQYHGSSKTMRDELMMKKMILIFYMMMLVMLKKKGYIDNRDQDNADSFLLQYLLQQQMVQNHNAKLNESIQWYHKNIQQQNINNAITIIIILIIIIIIIIMLFKMWIINKIHTITIIINNNIKKIITKIIIYLKIIIIIYWNNQYYQQQKTKTPTKE